MSSEYIVGKNYHVEDWLSVPETEVILRSPDDSPRKASHLAGIVNRLATTNPNAKVEYWIKIHP